MRSQGLCALQVITGIAVGLTMDTESILVPLLSEDIFGTSSVLVIASFGVSFGIVTTVLNGSRRHVGRRVRPASHPQ